MLEKPDLFRKSLTTVLLRRVIYCRRQIGLLVVFRVREVGRKTDFLNKAEESETLILQA